jgi:cytochrome c-type biogenesis protein CcmH
MSAFLAAAAGLAALALALLLRPLFLRREQRHVSRREANVAVYRDELRQLDADLAAGTLAREDYERERLELEARLLEDVAAAEPASAPPARRTSAWAVGLAVPLVAVAVYLVAGDPAALLPERQMPDAAQVEAMVERLAQKMREHPEDVEGWKLLGRSYTVMGRFPDAVAAYAKAAERSPRDAQLLADLADALAMARGQTMQGEPEKLVRRALEIDPRNLKALALLGTAAYERKDYAEAAETWGRMLPLVPEGSEDARAISENVAEAKKLAAIGETGVQGVVRISPQLAAKVKPDDVLFVFARAAEGPPMPLAVLRRKAADLPLEFRLDDSMAMAQGLKLSSFPRVIVAARISKSGNAAPQPGDLQGESPAVAHDARGVNVTIDSVVR